MDRHDASLLAEATHAIPRTEEALAIRGGRGRRVFVHAAHCEGDVRIEGVILGSTPSMRDISRARERGQRASVAFSVLGTT
ncbi:hypothetical protein ASF80_10665 [Microbacterium sp. Leaf159]|nr:hypothetical protein ASF80_10665 [Microbacterium sp. Leaf159]